MELIYSYYGITSSKITSIKLHLKIKSYTFLLSLTCIPIIQMLEALLFTMHATMTKCASCAKTLNNIK